MGSNGVNLIIHIIATGLLVLPLTKNCTYGLISRVGRDSICATLSIRTNRIRSIKNSNIAVVVYSSSSTAGNHDDIDHKVDDGYEKNDVECDFESYTQVPWGMLNPLKDISFDDYEALYQNGKEASGDAMAEGIDGNLEKHPSCDRSYDSVMAEWSPTVPALNHITIVGRVGYDPKPTYFENRYDGPGSKPAVVVNLSLAQKRRLMPWHRSALNVDYGQEETIWYNLECWGPVAEYALRFVEKGTRIGIVGSIRTNYFGDNKTGTLRTYPKIRVKDLSVLETKAESENRRMRKIESYGNNYGNNGMYNNREGNYNNINANYNNYNRGNNYNNNGGSYNEIDENETYDPSSAGGFFDPV